MKRYCLMLTMALLLLLSACQQAPSDQLGSSTMPPGSVENTGDGADRIKLDIPAMSSYNAGAQLTLRVDAQVHYSGYDSAPTYVCLPMHFDNSAAAAQAFFSDGYASVQRTEDRDTAGLNWPYQTDLPWIEYYKSPSGEYLNFTHGLGDIIGGRSSGVDLQSIPNIENWQQPGDADGDGRASGMRLSREECQAQAQALVDALGLDMLLVRTDVLDVTEFQNYRFYFAHNYGGIPSSIGVNESMRQYSWGQSLGEYLTICVCDNGIYDVEGMLYEIVETGESQALISAEEAVARLMDTAAVMPLPIEPMLASEYTIDSISLVYLPQPVEGDGVDVIGDGRNGGLKRNMIPAWQFATGYFSGTWSAIELYIDARTGEYLQ